MRFRRAVGLRADEEWARAVAADPRAGGPYEVPLLPEEVAWLESRVSDIQERLEFGASYGAEFRDGFAGAAIDPAAGFQLVLMYTKDLELHRHRLAAIAPELRPDIRAATWTLLDLERFAATVNEHPIRAPDFRIFGGAVDVLANRVVVTFQARGPEVGDRIADVLGSTGWVLAHWTGPLEPVDRPVGTILITIVDDDGSPQFDLPCRYTSTDPTIDAEGGGNSTREGKCRFENVPAGPYRIDILDRDEVVDRVLGTVDIVVVAEETRKVIVVVKAM